MTPEESWNWEGFPTEQTPRGVGEVGHLVGLMLALLGSFCATKELGGYTETG